MCYRKDQEIIISLISHLATTDFISRTLSKTAKDLKLSEAEVQRVLNKYTELFVEVPNNKETHGKPYYTLHLRYGLRRGGNEDRAPLSAEYLSSILNYVTTRVNQEESVRLHNAQNWVAVGAAIIAAIAAVVTAFISACG